MTKEEFKVIAKGMKSIYADPKFIPDQFAFDMWFTLLKDLSYEECSKATQMYMLSEKFPPTPSDIRGMIAKVEVHNELNGNEAWALVYKALCNGTYNSVSEFEKLPPLVQKAIGSAENLRSMATNSEFNEDVEKSHFIRVYDNVIKRQTEDLKLPTQIRQAITNDNVKMIGD